MKLDVERVAEISGRVAGRITALEREIWELAGRGVHDRLAAAAVRDPLQQARPVEEAAREDRLLDRRARAPGDPRRAPDHREDRGLARALQAEVDLPRRAAGADRRAHRPAPHDLQPDRDDDRAPVEHEPEPPERADPDRARPRDQVVLRRRGGPQADLGRLLAGRAARARPHRRARTPSRRSSGAARTCTRRRRARSSARRPRTSIPARARRPRWSTTASSTASPPTGSPTACRSRRRRRRSSSTATSTASRRSRSSSSRRSSTRARRDTSRRCSGGIRRIPELRARQWTTRSLGERLAVNTVIQGTAADILKVAMLRCHDALSDMRPEARAHGARRAAVRGS